MEPFRDANGSPWQRTLATLGLVDESEGLIERTQWADAGDGVRVWDKYPDGLVHEHSPCAFAQYGRLSAA